MRTLAMVVLALACALAMSPDAQANKYKPASGKYKLKIGDKMKVTTTGFGGCTFETIHENSKETDSDVATVSTPGSAGKKQVVQIEAVGAGTTTVVLETVGKDPGCFGFQSTYTLIVEGDFKAFEKQAKGKYKESLKSTKDLAGIVLDAYCSAIDLTLELYDDGEATADLSLQDSFSAIQSVADLVDTGAASIIDGVTADVWSRATAQGFTEMTPGLQGYLIGGCGEADKYKEGVEKIAEKLISAMKKKHKKFQKDMAKIAADDVLVLLGEIVPGFGDLRAVVEIPVADPDPQPAAPAKPLKKNFTSSGRLASSSTSRLHIGGSAEPGGGDVTVTITGPDDVETEKDVSVNEDCEWEAEFGSLPPGTYTVELEQDGNTVEFNVVVI